jgi:hypothetical protein
VLLEVGKGGSVKKVLQQNNDFNNKVEKYQ